MVFDDAPSIGTFLSILQAGSGILKMLRLYSMYIQSSIATILRGILKVVMLLSSYAGALERANLQPEQVNEVIYGNVLQAGLGQAPARQAAMVRLYETLNGLNCLDSIAYGQSVM